MKKYFNNIKVYILLDLIFYCILILSSSLLSVLLIQFIDGGYKTRFAPILISYGVLIIVYLISAYICNLLQWKYGIKFRKSLSLDYFSSVLNQKPKEYYNHPVNYYTEFNTQDVKAIEADYLMPMLSMIKSVLTLLIQFFVLKVYIDTYILLIVMALAILSLGIPKLTAKKISSLRENVVTQMKEFQWFSQNLLGGYPWVNPRTKQAFCKENEAHLDKQLNTEYTYGRFKSLSLVLNTSPNMIITFICLLLVGVSLKNGTMTFGVASALMMNIGTFIEPFSEMVYCINTMQSATTIKNNFLQFIKKHLHTQKMNTMQEVDSIHLKNLHYKTDEFLLEIDDLVLEKGKKYLIVGDNGAGKSTLLRILSKQLLEYDGSIVMESGEVCKDIRQLDTSNQIVYLQQKEQLFLTDYENNITVFGSYPYDKSKLIPNIKRENPLKEMSGGEKKVLLLDRVFNMNLPFILLDEPFAELSQDNRLKYYEYLLSQDNGIIIVSHDNMCEDKFDGIIHMKKKDGVTRVTLC